MAVFDVQRKTRSLRLSAHEIERARRSGAGVYVYEWEPSQAEAGLSHATHTVESVIEPVLTWCRDTLGRTRRPWGIAHFDLAMAVGGDDHPPRSISFRRLSPKDLYQGESLLTQLHRFLEAHPTAIGHVAVALFSWGDAAHELLPQT